jgi:hypothetical protein
MSATQALAAQALTVPDRKAAFGDLFRLARQVPCYGLRYADPSAAACEVTNIIRTGRQLS